MSLHRGPEQGMSLQPLSYVLFLFLSSLTAPPPSSPLSLPRQIDRLYDWKKSPETDVVATLKKQKKNTKDEFDERAKAVIVEFAQQVSPLFIDFFFFLLIVTLKVNV